jgi:hypothetical protein
LIRRAALDVVAWLSRDAPVFIWSFFRSFAGSCGPSPAILSPNSINGHVGVHNAPTAVLT